MTVVAPAQHVQTGDLWERIDDARISCVACAHRCPILDGFPGVCKVRFNYGGKLHVPWGYVSSLQCDPIEKKPFFHVHPGALAMSFGMLGCNLHCPWCQNWVISQASRDPRAGAPIAEIAPEQIVHAALKSGAGAVISTYNEPLITAEWAVSVFREARAAGLLTGVVSNGSATPEVLRYLRPWTDLYKVDLKSFSDSEYRKLGGRLAPVLDSIHSIHEMGFWLEVVTLVVPGFNDSDGELRRIAAFLAGISADIPWHVNAFHDDYKTHGRGATPATTLRRAADIGRSSGLRHVYVGNAAGFGALENTYCASCGTLLVRRSGFEVLGYHITSSGNCPSCSQSVPGIWRASHCA